MKNHLSLFVLLFATAILQLNLLVAQQSGNSQIKCDSALQYVFKSESDSVFYSREIWQYSADSLPVIHTTLKYDTLSESWINYATDSIFYNHQK